MISTITWHLPRPPDSRYPGGFPRFFERNLMQLLGYPDRVLQPFGGMAETGMRVDLRPEVQPDVVGDAHALPFADEEFDCVVLDPPYSDEEAERLYGTPALRRAEYTREAVRVLKEGGYLVVYTDREPARPARCNWTMRVVVILRPHHSPRVCAIFQKRKPGMPYYGTEPGEAAEFSRNGHAPEKIEGQQEPAAQPPARHHVNRARASSDPASPARVPALTATRVDGPEEEPE